MADRALSQPGAVEGPRDRGVMELLSSRGASLEATLADGQRALHLIAGATDRAPWPSGSPVSQDEGRVVFGAFLCARGVEDACAAPR